MKSMLTRYSRRRVLFTGAMATAAALLARRGVAAEDGMSRLSPDDPQAAALGYVEDAAQVDVQQHPKKAANQNCANCALYQAGASEAGWGACSIFPGKLVAGEGWCSAWVQKS